MMKASALLSLLGYSLGATFASTTARSEVLVDFGVNSTRVDADIATYPSIVTTTTSGYHVGAAVRRALEHVSFGARLELEDIDSNLLIAVRALDYKHAFTEKLSVGV